MSKKIEIIGKALVVTDTASGLIELTQPPVRTWYKEDDLRDGRISFYDLDGTEDESGTFEQINLSEAVDASLVAFTESSFRTFAQDNLGFSRASVSEAISNMRIDRVLEAESPLTSQEPTGLGLANLIQVTYGAAQFGSSDPVQIDANGLVTINEEGLYRIKNVFQFGRTGASGTSELLFRILFNGVQVGRSIGIKLGNSDNLNYVDIDNWFNVPADSTLQVQLMRDTSGNNSGGLFKTIPTDEGAETWSDVPCALIRIERFI